MAIDYEKCAWCGKRFGKQRKYYLAWVDPSGEYATPYNCFCRNCFEEHKNEIKKQHRTAWKREYDRFRLHTDKMFAMKKRVRAAITKSFLKKGCAKSETTQQITGMDVDSLTDYLINTFHDIYGYEWDGIESVHIDHIVPLATAQTEDEVIALCHYSNLRLIKAEDNLRKSAKLNYEIKTRKEESNAYR